MKRAILWFAAGLMVCLAADGVLAATYTAIDLNPSGSTFSAAYGISGNQQVGSGYGSPGGDNNHALLWNGSAAGFVDLNPSGFIESHACGISGAQQVGYGYPATGRVNHAILWNGSAASYVDLHPSGFAFSEAYGISGNQQVGYVSGQSTGAQEHAFLWSGSATSYVDLHPASKYGWSYAYGTNGTKQVGIAFYTANSAYHALLWSGSAASRVDLNPSGFTYSWALGISGNQQVGYGMGSPTGNNLHALLWNGSAASYVDLHQFLPAGFVRSSAASIDSYGNIAGLAYDTAGNAHAIVWSVPEPGTIGLLAIGGMLLRKRKV